MNCSAGKQIVVCFDFEDMTERGRHAIGEVKVRVRKRWNIGTVVRVARQQSPSDAQKMTGSDDRVLLPPMLGLQASSVLHETLQGRSGLPVVLDASQVTHLGAPCLQILISAIRTWREKSTEFHVTAPSAAFHEGLERLGFSQDELGIEDQPA